ncbi:hypothetical protein GA0070623_2119 [Micromonospora rifamycinica]|uniref:WD40-like Beta Propeller Repeat n=2 Tax=Micromonospora rifamycinica TaxID=291594 RepID=A0A1C5I5A9_9ACTN|nr:hypothetical protein GA0070623_2119 [Micromonospora rifamycinica]
MACDTDAMRRAVSSVTVALALLGAAVASAAAAGAAPASAAPLGAGPSATLPVAAGVPVAVPPVAAAVAGKKKCTITDERLRELSGLVATKTGYIVINDGTLQESRKRVFFLDTKCKIAKEPVKYSGDGPFDTEDLALSPDGKTLWIADTGDNVTSRERRTRVAVWTMPVSGSKQPVLHRLSYPERKPHDAEALLVGADGLPLVITKVPSGKAEIFTPEAKLDPDGNTEPVPMKKVGEITLPKTTTDNPLNIIGRVAITGAARSPDGSRVVLRTYADAFEYDVSGDDIVAALTTGKPRVTPLADPFGEAIAYTPDGTGFVTVSDGGELSPEDPIDILGYTPSTKGAETVEGAAGAKPAAGQSWYDKLSLDQITYLIGAVGAVGAVLVGAGIIGIVRSRRRAAAAGDDADDPDDAVVTSGAVSRAEGFPAGVPARGAEPAGERPRGGGVYGAPAPAGGPPARPAGGAVYGGGRPPAAPGTASPGGPGGANPSTGGRPSGGGVYGGGRPGGGAVYGAAPAGGPPVNGAGPRGAAPRGATRGGVPAGGDPRGGAPAGGRGGAPADPRGGAPAGPRGGAPAGGRGGAPAGGRGAGPHGGAPAGGRGGVPADPRGGAPAGGRGGPVGGRGRGGAPAGGRGAPPDGRGGAPAGGRDGAGGYGGGRAEPPRREGGPREPRSGPRRDGGHDDRRGGQYGPPPGRGGERY